MLDKLYVLLIAAPDLLTHLKIKFGGLSIKDGQIETIIQFTITK